MHDVIPTVTGAGVIEHVLVADARVQIGIDSAELGPGDLMSFAADQPHRCQSVDDPARIVDIHRYPRLRLA